MNILWVSIESPLPANSGGRIGIFKRIENLAKTNNIYYFYPYDAKDEEIYIDELKVICKEVHAYRRKCDIRNIFLSLRYPYTVASRNIDSMKFDIEKCIESNEIDIINVDFPHMLLPISQLLNRGNIPVVLNEHNLEWKVYKNISKSQKNLFKRIVYSLDSQRLLSFEKKIIDTVGVQEITFVSSDDMQEYSKVIPVDGVELKLIPVGADEGHVLPLNNKHNILFAGKMSYAPNIEAVKWFAKEVFPLIKEKVSDAHFYIVGKEPTNEIEALQSENITVTGLVEDMLPYYEMCNLAVLPLFHGGGVKVKLLEAIGYGRFIVSTTVGVEGTEYVHNGSIPISNNTKEYAKMCVERLLNPSDYLKEIEEAHLVMIEKYSWDNIGKLYSEVIENVCRKKNA